MDRSSLRKFLDRERIDPRSYGLDGPSGLRAGDRDERYSMEATSSGWVVYYSERGLRSGELAFDSEDEACRHVLDLLLRDDTNRLR
jgi:hypothetical protein